MPQLIALAPLLTAVAATTGAGVSIYSALNQPSAPKPPSPAEMTKNAIATETANREGAAKSAAQVLPGLQYNTNGGLSPDAYATLSSDFTGNAGNANSSQMKDLIAKFLGTGDNTFGGSSFGGGNPNSPGLTG